MPPHTGVSVHREEPPLSPIFAIRRSVFVEDQGIPAEDEFDGRDASAVQFLAREDGTPVGTARLRFPDPGIGKIERVAVREPYRGQGWGRRLVVAIEETARSEGVETLVLHAQTAVEGFYGKRGYVRTSDVYDEVGIPHVTMEKSL